MIFGVENFNFKKVLRELPESFQDASRRCRVTSLRVLRPETRLTVYGERQVVGRQLDHRTIIKTEVGN